jgi:hypothetical protein
VIDSFIANEKTEQNLTIYNLLVIAILNFRRKKIFFFRLVDFFTNDIAARHVSTWKRSQCFQVKFETSTYLYFLSF